MSTTEDDRGVSWPRGRRGPRVEILAHAAHRRGAEDYIRLLAVRSANAGYPPPTMRLAVLDGPTPSFLVITFP